MHRVGTWFQPRKLQVSGSTRSLDALSESQSLESAMRAATLIMNDDVEGAERGLLEGTSSYHKLGMGVILFLRATLGFEQDVIREASDRLAEAELSASNDLQKAQRGDRYNANALYAPGSEFALCNALAQIMGAVVAVLNESLADALRAFYKLRKAYITLNGLTDEEDRIMKEYAHKRLGTSKPHSSESMRSTGKDSSASKVPNGPSNLDSSFNPSKATTLSKARAADPVARDPEKRQDDGSDDDEFYDADEAHQDKPTMFYNGHIDIDPPIVIEQFDDLSYSENQGPEKLLSKPTDNDPFQGQASVLVEGRLHTSPASETFSSPTDVFVHSGVNLCFGLLLLLISAIPPVFGKLLYIIGFKGDRERGIKMLWQASKFNHINGGLAGLALLGWYNGLVGFCDIVPDADPSDPEDVEGYPVARLEALLTEMRTRYPSSLLWRVEEARMAATHRDLDSTIRVLSQTSKSSLQQVEALTVFEKGLAALYSHRYQLCSDSFIACVDLNSWSRALYYYIAASAHLATYRELKSKGKKGEAAKQASLAEGYFKLAPSHAGKKRIMARQLPFDTFVARKINKWTARASAWKCEFVDAIGVSPYEEMVFFWNGYKRMTEAQLRDSLANLAWSEDVDQNPHWTKEELDEHAILAVLRASIYRNLRQHEQAQTILKTQVLCHDKALFKGLHKDDWTAPTAHYEMGVNLWMQRSQYMREYGAGIPDSSQRGVEQTAPSNHNRVVAVGAVDSEAQQQPPVAAAAAIPDLDLIKDARLVSECREWIDKTSRWESYDLDARIGLKVTTAVDALRKWEMKHGSVKK